MELNFLKTYVDNLIKLSFPIKTGKKSIFIVDASTPLPSGYNVYSIEVLSDATISLIEDQSLMDTSAAYPTELVAGIITYGNFTKLEVTAGVIKAYIQ